jgi:hypothetical protein
MVILEALRSALDNAESSESHDAATFISKADRMKQRFHHRNA